MSLRMNHGRLASCLLVAACAAVATNVSAQQPKPSLVSQPIAKAIGPAVRTTAKPGANEVKEKTIAITGAKVYTGEGDPIEDAVVLVVGDKIQAVGKGLAAPAGAEVIQAKGLVVTPGLVESLTQVGLTEVDLEHSANDDSASPSPDRIRAAYRAADAYNPQSIVIPVSRLGGITSVAVVPKGGLVSGQSAWADLAGDTATDAIAAAPLALHVHLEAEADPQGGSRGAAVRVLREAFDDARFFQKNKAAWERNQSRAFSAGRLDLEALALTLGPAKKGAAKLPVVFHVNKASLILAALAVAKEFDLTPVIAGGAEAWRVRTTLAKSKVPVIVFPLLAGPESFDMLGARADNAALLHEAGVPLVLSTGETHSARKLRQVAGNAVRAGLPHTAAVNAITRAPAEALGMSDRYGTLTAGKLANLVVWSGDPLELDTRPVAVLVRGKKQPMESRQTQLFKKYRGTPR